MDYLEFIPRVTSHIPDKGQVIILCSRTSSSPQGTHQHLMIAAEENAEYF